MTDGWIEGFERVTIPQSPGFPHRAPITKVVWHCTVGWCAQHAFNVYLAAPGVGVCPNITAEYAGTGGSGTVREVTKRPAQHVPLTLASYALERGNKDHVCHVETNGAGVIQIERVGFPDDVVSTDELRWLGETVLAPILAACPDIPPIVFQGSRRMDETEWSTFKGQCGHRNVCCQPQGHSDPPELDLDLILHYALEYNDSLTPKDDDMVILTLDDGTGHPSVADGAFAYNGTHLRWVNDGNEYAMLVDDVKAKLVTVTDVKMRATIASTAKVGGAPTSGRYAHSW